MSGSGEVGGVKSLLRTVPRYLLGGEASSAGPEQDQGGRDREKQTEKERYREKMCRDRRFASSLRPAALSASMTATF